MVARIWKPGSGSQDVEARMWKPGSGSQDLVARMWKPGSGSQDLVARPGSGTGGDVYRGHPLFSRGRIALELRAPTNWSRGHVSSKSRFLALARRAPCE